jgi:hypothetical protein
MSITFVSDMHEAVDWSPYDVALEGRMGQTYNEKAFRYFLEIERKRSARSGRPLLLLLVDLKEPPKRDLDFDPDVVTRLFASLFLSLRESDVIGWYRERRVAGAVLPQADSGSQPEVSRLIRQRVLKALRGAFSDATPRFQVHVYQLQPTSEK